MVTAAAVSRYEASSDRLDLGDPLDRSWAVAQESGAVALSEDGEFVLCAECLSYPSARSDREVLGQLRIATTSDINRIGFCVGACSREMKV